MRKLRRWVIASFELGVMMIGLVVVGCGFRSPAAGEDASIVDTPMLDAAPDVPEADAPIDVGPICFGTSIVQICLQAPPTMTVTLGTQTIDTGTSSMCVPYTSIPTGMQACVIAGTAISLPGGKTFRAAGPYPLVLLSSGNIMVSGGGMIDVASRRNGTVGAAGNASQCISGSPPTQNGTTGSGGYGGSFGGTGGNGGMGISGGTGGMAAKASSAPTVLRGGCPGSSGTDGGSGAGARGNGGGAVLLIARDTIQIDGSINASGAGGRGGGNGTQAGGGGGGSGGMIVLDASMVTVSGGGQIWANGGGGGEGASDGASGRSGNDSSGPANAGTGGTGGTNFGGDGGAGSVDAALDGIDGGTGTSGIGVSGGGGAGGGGAGVILIHAATASGTGNTNNVAPPPVVTP